MVESFTFRHRFFNVFHILIPTESMTKPLVYNSKGPKNSIGQSSLTELTKLIIAYA